MALTGRRAGPPLGPPAELVARTAALARDVADAGSALGSALEVAPLELLAERAAIARLHRRGQTSVGGATRLLPTADDWIATSLARPDDVELVPAWLEVDVPDDPWRAVDSAVRDRSAAGLVARARLLGLPAAVLGERAAEDDPVASTVLGRALPCRTVAGIRVVELASLWAGPLCGSVLQAAGASVVKVESVGRPDGARRGPPAFFDLLNAGKASVAVDLATPTGRARLAEEIRSADVVIEGSRPRALEQLGVDAAALVAGDGPRTWLSITGHGRRGPARGWVAFGDDAAVAGGLVVRDEHGPVLEQLGQHLAVAGHERVFEQCLELLRRPRP